MDEDYRGPTSIKKSRNVYNSEDLYDAITNMNKAKVFKILEHQLENVNLKTVYKEDRFTQDTALHLIFKHFKESDVIEISEAFLDQDFDLDTTNGSEGTVLHLAVGNRMREAIEFLLKRNAKILSYDEEGYCSTHYFIENEFKKFDEMSEKHGLVQCEKETVEKESASFVEWLISKGFNFDYENFDEMSALDLAIKRNLQHILPILLKHTRNIHFVNRIDKRTLLHSFFAAQNECRQKRIGFRCPRETVLSENFTKRYDIEIVKILLDNKVSVNDIDVRGDTALHIATKKRVEMDIVEMLLQRFTNIHYEKKSGKTLLYEVIEDAGQVSSNTEYYAKIIRALIAKGALAERRIHNRIMVDIITSSSLRAVELMRDLGMDFKIDTYDGQNLLHKRAISTLYRDASKEDTISYNKSQEGIIDLLVNEGCDVNKVDYDGHSPLHLAAAYGNTAVARKLIAHGADVNCREKKGKTNTPLHFTANKRRTIKTAELLLDSGADINNKNVDGERPLHLSVLNGSNRMTKMLLRRGAYVNVRATNGETALSRAILQRCPISIEELLKYGADVSDSAVTQLLELIGGLYYDLQYNFCWSEHCLPHWVKLKAAKLSCSTEIDCYVPANDYNNQLYKKYLKEIERLKSTLIDSCTSLYDFLHMNINDRCIHINNEKLLDLINSPLFEKDFSEYFIPILGSYHETIARKSLLGPAKKAWFELTNIDLPDICIERIFAYLTNADLVIIIERNETIS